MNLSAPGATVAQSTNHDAREAVREIHATLKACDSLLLEPFRPGVTRRPDAPLL